MNNKTVQFHQCSLHNASFIETKMNKTSFQECDLTQCEFLHAPLYKTDLSSCQIEGIITSPEDIRGAMINSFQAIDLIHLLNVKIKDS